MASDPNIEVYNVTFSLVLGARLRELRKATGDSQEDVANRAGIARNTYQKYENGESKPGTPMNLELYTLLALSRAFGIEVTKLLDIDLEHVDDTTLALAQEMAKKRQAAKAKSEEQAENPDDEQD